VQWLMRPHEGRRDVSPTRGLRVGSNYIGQGVVNSRPPILFFSQIVVSRRRIFTSKNDIRRRSPPSSHSLGAPLFSSSPFRAYRRTHEFIYRAERVTGRNNAFKYATAALINFRLTATRSFPRRDFSRSYLPHPVNS
jgi:hypothetical protein